ncbi:c-type cytochrome [Hymenobacter sp. ASUV-10]|uniref:C-type cytochrome n=1 Tax=Hymenobacter aranciens TaxID=3063996 RepID=A0ABT9BC60_9BACT|nr:c-type cytochrome [Hymenobacter sp. ASUV-10]MDO7875854.1 c-type cytochrome [Hymenobacter sp. ASUV-10]
MKTNFLSLLSLLALLTACDTGYKPDGPDVASAERAAASAPNALNQDSAANAKKAAVTHQEQVDTANTHIGTTPTGVPAGGQGAQLVAKSDCASCHRETDKLIGPGYKEIAGRYPNTPANVALLGSKIIGGGSGSWGSIPMTPHPSISESDAREMAKYILALK